MSKNLLDKNYFYHNFHQGCSFSYYLHNIFRAVQGDPATNFLMKNMNSLINEYYSLIYSVKVKEGIKSKIRKGEWNGQSPFGYDLVKSHLQVNEEESNIIKLIFDLYLSKSWDSEKICNYLNENGIKPPKNSKYWSKTSIICMLKNEAYTGITVYNKRAPEGSGRKYNPQNEWLVIPNTHTPIYGPILWVCYAKLFSNIRI